MEFTGERYVPHLKGTIELEHMHRYRHVLKDINNKTVLDIACGEGYGAALLATSAGKVIGVDIDHESIAHAKKNYHSIEHLEFMQGSLTKIPLPDNSIDVITCFESIEHIVEHDVAFLELKRVLKKNGTLYMSTPEKRNYSDLTGYRNPFHPKELYLVEFSELLSRYFKFHTIQGQRVLLSSVILGAQFGKTEWLRHSRFPQTEFLESATYLVSKASDLEFTVMNGSIYEGTCTLDELLVERPLMDSFSNMLKAAIKSTNLGFFLYKIKTKINKLNWSQFLR